MQHKITIKSIRQVVILYDTDDDEYRSAADDVVEAIQGGWNPFDGTYEFNIDQTLVNDWVDGDRWAQAQEDGTGNVTDTKTLPTVTQTELKPKTDITEPSIEEPPLTDEPLNP